MRTYLKSLMLLVILLNNKGFSQERCYPKKDIIVYYVNGINTYAVEDDNGYFKNWEALSTHVIKEYIKRRNGNDSKLSFNFVEKSTKEYYFNQSEGFINDIYESSEQKIKEWNDDPEEGETYREMRERIALKYQALSGYEVDSSTTKAIYNSIPKDQAPIPEGSVEEFVDHLKKERLKYEIINSTAEPRVQDVEKLYFKLVEHINNKDRVILFSHSQGNLFMDEVIKEMNDNGIDFSKYLINVRYGSPSGPGTSAGLNYKDVKYHTDFVTGYIGIPQTHHAKGSRTPSFVYKMNHLLVKSKRLELVIPGITSTLVSSAITGDATGHGMKECYVEPNIMTSEDDLSFANPVRANELSMNYLDELFESFGDTCDYQIKLKDEDDSGKLEDYIQIDNYSADKFKISLKTGAPLYTDFKEFIALDTATEELKTTINISGGYISERSTNPPYVLVFKPFANGNIHPYKLNISIGFKYKYLEEFDYTGSFSDELEICTGRDCCSTADNVEFDESNGLCKVKDGVMVSHSCSKGTLEGKDVCIAKTVCKYQPDHLSQYGDDIPELPSISNPEVNENNWTYTSYKANDHFYLYNGVMKSDVTSHCGAILNYEDREAAISSCECTL